MTTWLGNSPYCWPFVWGIHLWLVVYPHKRPPMQSHGVFSVQCLNNPLNKQSIYQWFETPWCPCDPTVMLTMPYGITGLKQYWFRQKIVTPTLSIYKSKCITHLKSNAYNPDFLALRCQLISSLSGTILCMRPANEGRRYSVTSSLIGWAHAQKDPCIFSGLLHWHWAPVPVK